MADPLVFTGSPLDRAGNLRRDARWLTRQIEAEATRFLPLWRLQPLAKTGEVRTLAWARRVLFSELEQDPEPILLGVADDVAHFAVDVTCVEQPEQALGVAGVASFEELRAVAPQLPASEAAVAAQARSLVDWHARHPHCAACGSATRSVFGGSQRSCIECAAEHFPRTDPVAIALVSRGERCLLGRQRGWPERLYSALAGYVEPGESVEEAVRREVLEESGVVVGRVRYVGSQPWPFPSSLMLGCLAEAESEAIQVDRSELEDAAWFDRATLRAALAAACDELIVPPALAIAHQLMRAWADGEA